MLANKKMFSHIYLLFSHRFDTQTSRNSKIVGSRSFEEAHSANVAKNDISLHSK